MKEEETKQTEQEVKMAESVESFLANIRGTKRSQPANGNTYTTEEFLANIDRMIEEGKVPPPKAPESFDKTVADGHSETHKRYLDDLADRTFTETEKVMKRILMMRARIAHELEDERLQDVIKAKVQEKAEEKGWDATAQETQVEASKKFLLDVLQDDMMQSLGTLAVGKHLHRNDANMMTFMGHFLAEINDPKLRKMMAREAKRELQDAGFATHDLDQMERAMGWMPRLRAVLKKDDTSTLRGIGVRLHGTYSETWAMCKGKHREEIDAVVRGIVGKTELDKSLMSDMIGLAQHEVERMWPGARGSFFSRELRRIKDSVAITWGIGLDPDTNKEVQPDTPDIGDNLFTTPRTMGA